MSAQVKQKNTLEEYPETPNFADTYEKNNNAVQKALQIDIQDISPACGSHFDSQADNQNTFIIEDQTENLKIDKSLKSEEQNQEIGQ